MTNCSKCWPHRASPIALRLLLVPLCFSRTIFPSLSHLEQSLAVFCVHQLHDADAVGRIFPVRFRVLQWGGLPRPPDEKRLMADPSSAQFHSRDSVILGTKNAWRNCEGKSRGLRRWRQPTSITSTSPRSCTAGVRP